jgi:methyl-accepting chemotaxis protein-1 (serine sensor receptor)
MFKNLTIRTGLSITIASYTLVLLASITAAVVGVHRRNVELEEMYSKDTVALVALETGVERLLQPQLALGEAETIGRLGDDPAPALAKARKLLGDSRARLTPLFARQPTEGDERTLSDALRQKHEALVTNVIKRQIAALERRDFQTFRAIHEPTADALYTDYRKASAALETYHVERERQRYEVAARRFEVGLWVFVLLGVGVVLLGLFARIALAAAIVRPVDVTIQHFEKIAAGDLTSRIAGGSRKRWAGSRARFVACRAVSSTR